ncbi:MAG: hypothetical protein ACYDHW_00370 [Syntrophorhabdaceae bacterium]
MKKIFMIALFMLIGLAFVTTGFAETHDTMKGKTYTGTVSSVDATAKSLVVKGKDGDKTFDVTDAKWKGYSTLDQVKAGDRITVNYMEKDGTMSAKTVMKAKTKSKTTTKTKSTTTKTKTDSPDAEPK